MKEPTILSPKKTDRSPLFGRCVRCACFQAVANRSFGDCVGKPEAFEETKGRKSPEKDPEKVSFQVRRMDGCSHFKPTW